MRRTERSVVLVCNLKGCPQTWLGSGWVQSTTGLVCNLETRSSFATLALCCMPGAKIAKLERTFRWPSKTVVQTGFCTDPDLSQPCGPNFICSEERSCYQGPARVNNPRQDNTHGRFQAWGPQVWTGPCSQDAHDSQSCCTGGCDGGQVKDRRQVSFPCGADQARAVFCKQAGLGFRPGSNTAQEY